MKHIVSFFKSPLGYLFNLLATIDQYVRIAPGRFLSWGCDTFCLNDGVQDDPLF